MSMDELEHLRKVLNPVETIPTVEQCRIVADALKRESVGNTGDLADYLGLSKSNISKMTMVHRNLIDELKDWYITTAVGVSTLYHLSKLSVEAQEEHLKNALQLGT